MCRIPCMINTETFIVNETKVRVKLNGEFIEGLYVGMNDRYHLPKIKLPSGQVVLRKIYGTSAESAVSFVEGPIVQDVPARYFDINQRFQFLNNLVTIDRK